MRPLDDCQRCGRHFVQDDSCIWCGYAQEPDLLPRLPPFVWAGEADAVYASPAGLGDDDAGLEPLVPDHGITDWLPRWKFAQWLGASTPMPQRKKSQRPQRKKSQRQQRKKSQRQQRNEVYVAPEIFPEKGRLITLREAGAYLSVHPKTVGRWIERGYLWSVRLPGGHLRTSRVALDEATTRT